jgi:hypothetical protein
METLQRTANRGSISTGYDIDNSLKFEEDNSENITTTNQAAGDRKTWTFSAWIKRTDFTYDYATIFGAEFTIIKFLGDDRLGLELYNGTYYSLITTQKFRDPSAWYHIVAVCDTTQATASERSRLYVNGERVTVFDTSNSPPLNSEFAIGQAGAAGSGAWLRLGQFFAGSDYFSGYMAEVHYLNGTAAQASDFGEYDSDSGIWIPKEYTGGGYGTQGFYYKFDNAASLGEDSSGEGHDANSINNITSADQATDTPTNNFCTFNPLMTQNNPPTISEGAMKSTGGGGTWNQTWGNIGVKNGKWYYEFKVANSASTGYFGASTTPAEGSSTAAASLMYNTSVMVGGAARIDYSYWQNGSQVANESTGWGTISTNDVIGIALDLDSATKTFTVYKNGTALSGTLSQPVDLPTNMQDEFIFPLYVQYENRQDEANFGGYTISSISSAETDENGYGTFEYAPPSGYYALCTKNLAEFG